MLKPEQARWFHEEVQPHEPLLRAYLQKQFPALPDLDDVVQESHLRLLKAREKHPIGSAKSYLFAIARNVALGVFRRRQDITAVPVNDMEGWRILEGETHVAESASLAQETALATEAIDALPARCREIVILRALRGRSHQEIAAQLGLSEATVLGLGVIHESKRHGEFDRRFRVPGYTVVNGLIAYDWGRYAAALNVENLLDDRYVVRIEEARLANFGAPLSFKLSLSAKF